jgi:tetratricopeptide (TPR) repeat protein
MMHRIMIFIILAMTELATGSWAQAEMDLWRQPFLSASGASFSQEDDLYRIGTDNLNKGKWDQAVEQFEKVVKQQTPRAAAALYWKAYALNKLGRSSDALKAIAELRKSHPQSEWINDGDALELEIIGPGVAGGVRGGIGGGVGGGIGGGVGSGIGSGIGRGAGGGLGVAGDEDLKLLALNFLMRSDSARAMPALKKLLESSNSPRVKESVLFVLAQSSSPDAQRLLLETAIKQSDPELQRKAVQFIAAQPTQQHLAALEEIYRTSGDKMVRRSILDAYVSCGCRKELFNIARRETNLELKRHAIESLAALGDREGISQLYREAGSPAEKGAVERALVTETRRIVFERLAAMGGMATLVEIYIRESDLQSKQLIIDSLAAIGAAKELIIIDRSEKDSKLHRKIIEALSNLSGPEVQDYMIEILNK